MYICTYIYTYTYINLWNIQVDKWVFLSFLFFSVWPDFVASQCHKGDCMVPPPQEHMDQAFIPDRISRTEVVFLRFFFKKKFSIIMVELCGRPDVEWSIYFFPVAGPALWRGCVHSGEQGGGTFIRTCEKWRRAVCLSAQGTDRLWFHI